MPRQRPGRGLWGVALVCTLVGGTPSLRRAAASDGTEALTALMRAAPVSALRPVGAAPGLANSPRNASYRLKAVLDEPNHRIRGEGVLTWRNLERQPVDSRDDAFLKSANRHGRTGIHAYLLARAALRRRCVGIDILNRAHRPQPR